MNHKGKVEEFGLVSLVEESKAMFTKTPPKLKDPGCFTIPCRIDDIVLSMILRTDAFSLCQQPFPQERILQIVGEDWN